MYVVRLTKAQLDVVCACMSFVGAGEIGGGPLCGMSEDDAETRRNLAVYKRACKALWEAKQG